jgi:hypothetical protein
MPKGKKNKFGASMGPGLGEDAAEVILHDLFSCADALCYDHVGEAGTDQYHHTTFLGRQSSQERPSGWGHQSHGKNDIRIETLKL